MHDKQVRRRRAVLGLLVAVSLVLLTAYFGESPSSPLHSVQRGIVAVLSPVQDGASKVLSPISDVANWVSDTVRAKSRSDVLQRRVNELTAQLATAQQEAISYHQLANEVGLDQSIGASSYHPVAASVTARDPSVWYQTVQVNAGSDEGVSLYDPVIGDQALVGDVTTVSGSYSIVTLVTDPAFAVAAEIQNQRGDTGLLVPAVGSQNRLELQNLTSNNAPINPGQLVVTAGFTDPANPVIKDAYPAGIPIGTVTNANPNELLNSSQVTVTPLADLRHFESVQILTRPQAGTERAQAP